MVGGYSPSSRFDSRSSLACTILTQARTAKRRLKIERFMFKNCCRDNNWSTVGEKRPVAAS